MQHKNANGSYASYRLVEVFQDRKGNLCLYKKLVHNYCCEQSHVMADQEYKIEGDEP